MEGFGEGAGQATCVLTRNHVLFASGGSVIAYISLSLNSN